VQLAGSVAAASKYVSDDTDVPTEEGTPSKGTYQPLNIGKSCFDSFHLGISLGRRDLASVVVVAVVDIIVVIVKVSPSSIGGV
jgi:hypothetical protein